MSLYEALTSPRTQLSRRRSLRLFAVAVSAAALAACADGSGFRPLYGDVGVGAGKATEAKLAQIEFAPVGGRVGQRLRNELIFQSTGGSAPLPPTYRLEIIIKESLASTLVQRDGDSLSQIYGLDASFRLVSLADKKVILQGSSFGRVGFERFSSIFSNVRAREDAENRAAKTVATEIYGRLAAFLSRPA